MGAVVSRGYTDISMSTLVQTVQDRLCVASKIGAVGAINAMIQPKWIRKIDGAITYVGV